jgi:hypothetical protein
VSADLDNSELDGEVKLIFDEGKTVPGAFPEHFQRGKHASPSVLSTEVRDANAPCTQTRRSIP